MAEFIYQEASKLDFHLQNIFTAATIEAGLEELELSHIDIEQTHNETIEKLKINIKEKNLIIEKSIKGSDNEPIVSDLNKLKLILTNIISNSIKHSNNEGIIECEYLIEDNHLKIKISDNGNGISENDLKTIYDRFNKIDNNINSVTGGAGLGLSVVKALIELMGGEIEIINKNGTVVEINFPLASDFEDDSFSEDALFDEEIF
jgi:signal transduction histidine kinase